MTLELKRIIEALLFSAERPLAPKEIRTIFAEATDEENPGMVEPFRNVREAQIVTAPSCSTTSIFTSSGSLRLARFVAVTSVSPLLPATARTSPFTPLISISLPAAIFPFQWKSPCANTGAAANAAATASTSELRIIGPPS